MSGLGDSGSAGPQITEKKCRHCKDEQIVRVLSCGAFHFVRSVSFNGQLPQRLARDAANGSEPVLMTEIEIHTPTR